MSVAIGIDAGGTKLAAGRVDIDTGNVSDRRLIDTRRSRGGAAVLADVVELARGLGPDVMAIGIGVPEMVDAQGAIQSAANWDWRDLDLALAFDELPRVRIVSDVYAAARISPERVTTRACTSALDSTPSAVRIAPTSL